MSRKYRRVISRWFDEWRVSERDQPCVANDAYHLSIIPFYKTTVKYKLVREVENRNPNVQNTIVEALDLNE